jgi:integrase
VLPDEEQRLLNAAGTVKHGAGVRLQWLIIAAIETGCRRGELLSLRWADVNLPKRTLLVRAVVVGAKKTDRARLLPVSTRLAGAHVFGALGEQLKDIKKAWETAVLRSACHDPEWVRSALAAESRRHLAAVDLHFHDLRHEAGCRWLSARGETTRQDGGAEIRSSSSAHRRADSSW